MNSKGDPEKAVREIKMRFQQLANEAKTLKRWSQSLDLPALKRDFLDQILTNLEGVVRAVPAPQIKHLLHLLVKKVLVRDRRTVETWYRLPQESPVRTLSDLVAPMGQYANHSRFAPREVIFAATAVI